MTEDAKPKLKDSEPRITFGMIKDHLIKECKIEICKELEEDLDELKGYINSLTLTVNLILDHLNRSLPQSVIAHDIGMDILERKQNE